LRFSWLFSASVVVILLGTVLVIAISLNRSRSPNANAEQPITNPRAIPEGMVYVTGGEFMMGSNNGDEYEQPSHKVSVNPFLIDVYEVTCGEYEKFVEATGHRVPLYWTNGICPRAAQRKPVVGVDWHDATTYAKWASKRLPTEEEWEFAARGSDGRKFPWGNEWQANVANAGDSSAGDFVDVGSYPLGKSPFGVMDMIGNAWEWTASDLKPYPGGRLSKPPQEERKLMRGASWFKDQVPDWTATFRGFAAPAGGKDYTKVGFRCAKDITVFQNEK
jgi:serine/threonine-protein kinase